MTDEASQREEHWRRTRSLMVVHLVIWFIFAFLIHWFAPALNTVSFLHFPLGFYMAAQGSLAIFVIQLFFFVRQQDRIDIDCGMAEDQ
jgi:putative solute:sodium symporter small subunit